MLHCQTKCYKQSTWYHDTYHSARDTNTLKGRVHAQHMNTCKASIKYIVPVKQIHVRGGVVPVGSKSTPAGV